MQRSETDGKNTPYANAAGGWIFRLLSIAFFSFLISGCTEIDDLRDAYRPRNMREAYEIGLESSGLGDTEMVSLWHQAGSYALNNPVIPSSAHRERGFSDPVLPGASGFEIYLNRGERLVAETAFLAPASGKIFLDLFLDMEAQSLGLRQVAASDSSQHLTFDANRTGRYVLRLQPELLVSGEYQVEFRKTSSVIFPVAGKNSSAIQSRFGEPRDGGRRSHHGVDIFASRRTPVIAAVSGTVSRVQNGGLGGKTVWLRDARSGSSFYYAHLDEQFVRRGQRVLQGDTLGLVGNTGNARTTPPHLHFGIYSNGPIDPYPYVHSPSPKWSRLDVTESNIGTWMRTNVRGAVLRSSPNDRSSRLATLNRFTSVRAIAGSGSFYRVVLPDGATGYISDTMLESALLPIGEIVLTESRALQSDPTVASASVGLQLAGNRILVNGRFGDFLRVQTESGQTGWLQDAP